MGLKDSLRSELRVRLGRATRPMKPRTTDPHADLREAFGTWEPSVIFDIGANVGQSATEFAHLFPSARILSFEPVSSTFGELKAAAAKAGGNVECFQLAMGDERGTVQISLGGTDSTQASIHADAGDAPGDSETVTVETVDAFCAEHGIATIDFLKIDTEGNDLNALRGADGMLGREAIAVVEVEAGMHPDNDLHVPMETLKAHLEGKGYRLFGIYEQFPEWTTRSPFLRRSNLLFIPASAVGRSED